MGIRSKTIRSLLPQIRTNGFRARQATGKSVAAQALEMLSLAWGVGKLHPEEYYQYRLYDDRRYGRADKSTFLGRVWQDGLYYALGSADWGALVWDKLIWAELFGALGLPVPRTIAVYHPFRSTGGLPALRDRNQFVEFLRTWSSYPLFVKPIWGVFGRGVAGVTALDADSGRVRLENGESIEVTEFVDRMIRNGARDRAATSGCIVQELLRPHSSIGELTGNRLCSVRAVTILGKNGPRILATPLKIATGSSMADNYWEQGNLIADVDSDTGRLGAPITGLGPDIRPVLEHPDTGRRLEGFQLPDWDALKDLCRRATVVLPGMPMQSWDVALTDRGPVLIEVNAIGGFRIPQLVADRGLYHGEFKEFVESHGFPRLRIRKPKVKRL